MYLINVTVCRPAAIEIVKRKFNESIRLAMYPVIEPFQSLADFLWATYTLNWCRFRLCHYSSSRYSRSSLWGSDLLLHDKVGRSLPGFDVAAMRKTVSSKKKNSFDVKEMIEKPFFINCLFWEWGHHGLVLVLICLCRHQLKCLFFVLLWFLYWFCADSSTPRQHTGGELSLPRLRPVSVNR